MDALAEKFDLTSVSRSSAKFDPDDLKGLNARLVHDMPYADAKDRLDDMGVGGRRGLLERRSRQL
jgi:glutamyl-tRNA synthetase